MELKKLCSELIRAKKEEDAAKKRRIDIETEIVKIVGSKESGSQTTKQDGFKITTKGDINVRMDWDQWAVIKGNIPANLWPVVTKAEVDKKGILYLRNNEPELYQLLPIQVSPAKVGVTVEIIEQE